MSRGNGTTKEYGFTAVELVIAVAILAAITLAVSTFQRDVFSIGANIQESLTAQLGARAALRQFTTEVREAAPSSLGAYPIAVASTTEFVFYVDGDDDGDRERVRYFVSGGKFRKGVIEPSGSPLSYAPSSEELTTIVSDVVNGATPVFEYYSGAYNGSGSVLAQPVQISAVRLVKLTVLVDEDPNRAPDAFVLTTAVSIRNLKDNL